MIGVRRGRTIAGNGSLVRAGAAVLSFLGLLNGCGLLFPGVPDGPIASTASATLDSTTTRIGGEPLPPGYGTLRQADISMALRRGEVQVRVTPLDESVIRVTASDTYERLSALGRGHQEIFREETGSAVPFQLFLVSLFSESTEVAFEPEALNIVNRGLRSRPVEIRAVTPGWESRLLLPGRVLMAVYAFPLDVDLERDIEVEYQEVRSRDWQRILPLIQRERVRLLQRGSGLTQD